MMLSQGLPIISSLDGVHILLTVAVDGVVNEVGIYWTMSLSCLFTGFCTKVFTIVSYAGEYLGGMCPSK